LKVSSIAPTKERVIL